MADPLPHLRPYDVLGGLSFLRRIPRAALLALVPTALCCALLISSSENTRGEASWTSLLDQLSAPFNNAGAAPEFEFLQDPVGMAVLAVSGLTWYVIHLQWSRMFQAVPALIKSGVLRFDTVTEKDRVRRVINGANRSLRRAAGWSLVATLLVLGVLFLVLYGGYRHGIFEAFAPGDQTPGERSAWLKSAYASWWASLDHPAGFAFFSFVCFLGGYGIVLQNVVGVVTATVLRRLGSGNLLRFDYDNVDHHCGWAAVAKVFSTVRWSMALHGLGIAVLVLYIGPDYILWISPLVAAWVTFFPMYLITPTAFFNTLHTQYSQVAIAELKARAGGGASSLSTGDLREAISAVRDVSIRIVWPSYRSLAVNVVSYLLPIASFAHTVWR
jgi:hypothetical protein